MKETTDEHSAAQPQQKSHRRDAEVAEKETTKQTSLRTPRLCGEKNVEENPCQVAKNFRLSSTVQPSRNQKNSPQRHGGHGDFTENSPCLLRVLRASVVKIFLPNRQRFPG